ncbi:hypothetical protein JCM17846_27840 [Iodidimonas nitroreducens]|uniref:Nitrogen fixation protein FixH n=2 Tax=Iodidimonas nitroreducens TaxID=1236968 RepID=A0A5A7NA44_9PROT|nr:hypothetical protein JCM17846_27840 [Iodidimonas nitroreducens]
MKDKRIMAVARAFEKPLTGRKVLLIFCGFFGLILGANIIMMVFAAMSYDGVQEEDAYRKGRDYNDVLAAAAAQNALGWQVEFDQKMGGMVLQRQVFARFLDDRGQPLDDLDVRATFFSPIEEEHDTGLGLANLGAGRYEGMITVPRAGRWELRISAVRGDAQIFHQRKEVFIAP